MATRTPNRYRIIRPARVIEIADADVGTIAWCRTLSYPEKLMSVRCESKNNREEFLKNYAIGSLHELVEKKKT